VVLTLPKENEVATSDAEQKSVNVRQHKRIAQGEKLNGTSYGSKGGDSKPKGGLSHTKKNK
jgi:hypothetical protein